MKVNIRIRLLTVAILSIVFLMFGFLFQNDYALACEGSITKICSILGDDPKPSILDQDMFKFYGTKGEKVTVHLGMNPSGSHTGERVTLILMDNIKRRWLFREDRSALENEIRAILAATGEYQIFVNEQPKFLPGKEFKGAYCLTLESAKEAWLTLEPTSWVEPDASAVIGPKGGIIEVTDPENELYRVRVDIPPGSLDGNKAIVIDRIDIGSVLPGDTTTGGIAIDLKPDGTVFNNNIFVTLPYDDNDNDGLVDHTGIPEENIKVITWDSNTHTWINEDIIGQDKQNNTVTFATNHFSPHTTSVECIYSNDVSIFTIDGLDFVRTFFPIHFNYPSRVNYLLDSLLDMNIPGINKCDIYSFGGLTPDKSWNGDATKTKDLIKDLNNLLVIFDLAAKKTGKKFIVVSHSWGTQLATFAMSYSGLGIIRHQIQPDLFITLSNPAGSNLVSETQYSNDFFYESTPPPPATPIYVSVKEAQSKVENFVNSRKQEVIEKWGSFNSEMIPQKWINYWDVGDIFSGPLDKNNSSATIDDKTVRNDEERNLRNTEDVHAITSLSKKNWKDYGVVEEGENFSKKVKAEIEAVILNQQPLPKVSLTIDDPITPEVENLEEFDLILQPGQSLPRDINLNWIVTNQATAQATNCILTCESGNCGSGWSGTILYPSITSQSPTSVTSAVVTYGIYCTGPGGDGPKDTVRVLTGCYSRVCSTSETCPNPGMFVITSTYVCQTLCTRDAQCEGGGGWGEIPP